MRKINEEKRDENIVVGLFRGRISTWGLLKILSRPFSILFVQIDLFLSLPG